MNHPNAITQEITQHRISSYSHESTRYVKYDGLEIIPFLLNDLALAAVGALQPIYKAFLEGCRSLHGTSCHCAWHRHPQIRELPGMILL